MGDLQNPRLIYLKGGLFLFLGCFAASILLIENASWRTATLLSITIWSFCRSYYFAFYVIEHYVDGSYRFAGLIDCIAYCAKQRNQVRAKNTD